MRLLVFTAMLTVFLNAASYQAYTENMPPYNYVEDGKVKGYSTYILKELLQVSGNTLKKDIRIEPWANSLEKVENTPNTILYSIARAPNREEKFSWIGPIDTMEIGLLAKKNNAIKIKDKSDLNNYTIATIPTSMAENLLLKEGVLVNTLDRFSLITSQLKKLRDDRVDAVAFSVPGMLYIMPKLGMKPEKYEMVYLLKEVDLYFGFNKETSSEKIKEFNSILKDLNRLHRVNENLR